MQLRKWWPYLIWRNFNVEMDHNSLKYCLEQYLSLEEKQYWVTRMLYCDFEVIYEKGKQNVVVDALSRKIEDIEGLIYVISFCNLNGWKKQR